MDQLLQGSGERAARLCTTKNIPPPWYADIECRSLRSVSDMLGIIIIALSHWLDDEAVFTVSSWRNE